MVWRSVGLTALLVQLAAGAQAADVVLVRKVQTEASQWDTQSTIDGFVNAVREAISDLGVAADTIDDREVTAAALAAYKLVVLPHNPGLPDALVDALRAFVDGGGKLLTFYQSDPRVLSLIGLTGARYVGGNDLPKLGGAAFAQTLLAGAPTLWRQRSWNINEPLCAEGGARVAATWVDVDGRDTGLTAATVHDNGVAFAHVLLDHDRAGAGRFLLAVLGRSIPNVWPAAVERRLADVWRVGAATSANELRALVGETSPAAKAALTRAQELVDRAQAAAAAQDHPAAYDLAGDAAAEAQSAFLLAQRPRSGELRAAWIHTAYGVGDWGWDRTIRTLAEHGFNAIFVNMCWGAVADYQSEVLPVHPDVAEKGDQIEECLAACRKYGVELHVWRVNWNMGHRTPADIRERMTAAGRTQVDIRGQPSLFLAPHLQENYELERDAMLEIVRKYPVDGIHFDYIRYPGTECDFSDSARQAFEQWLGAPAEGWPESCHSGPLRSRYNAWRRSQINRLVQAVSEGAHAIRPEIQVSAAVFPDWDTSPEWIAQATEEWIDHGWLDFVCPMDYTSNDRLLRSYVERQVRKVAGRIPLYIGLGSWQHTSPAQTAEQIRLSRALGADGFICFELVSLSRATLAELAKGATSEPAGLMPHRSMRPVFTLPPAEPKLPPAIYPLGRTLRVRVALDPQRVERWEPVVAVEKDGWPTDLAARSEPDGVALDTEFTPVEPGLYRIRAEGRWWATDGGEPTPLLARSGTMNVVSAAEYDDLMARTGPPRFAGTGGIKVAVWHNAYGAEPLLRALRAIDGFDVAPLYNFDPSSLAACDVVVLPQPRRDVPLFQNAATIAAVRAYLESGGGVLVTHALVGIRGFTPFGERVATGGETLGGRSWRVVVDHPVTAGLAPQTFESTFPDRISVRPSADGVVVAATEDGTPLVAVGPVGRGRYVACGLGVAIGNRDEDVPPSAAELTLVANALRWLAGRDG